MCMYIIRPTHKSLLAFLQFTKTMFIDHAGNSSAADICNALSETQPQSFSLEASFSINEKLARAWNSTRQMEPPVLNLIDHSFAIIIYD